jgi:hypothetical protein
MSGNDRWPAIARRDKAHQSRVRRSAAMASGKMSREVVNTKVARSPR